MRGSSEEEIWNSTKESGTIGRGIFQRNCQLRELVENFCETQKRSFRSIGRRERGGVKDGTRDVQWGEKGSIPTTFPCLDEVQSRLTLSESGERRKKIMRRRKKAIGRRRFKEGTPEPPCIASK